MDLQRTYRVMSRLKLAINVHLDSGSSGSFMWEFACETERVGAFMCTCVTRGESYITNAAWPLLDAVADSSFSLSGAGHPVKGPFSPPLCWTSVLTPSPAAPEVIRRRTTSPLTSPDLSFALSTAPQEIAFPRQLISFAR